VQVRGKFNRTPTAREQQVLTEWAGVNNLAIATHA
jgi:hypothetical protein